MNPNSKRGPDAGPKNNQSNKKIEPNSCHKETSSVPKQNGNRKCNSAGSARNGLQTKSVSSSNNGQLRNTSSSSTLAMPSLKNDRPSARLNPKTIDPFSNSSKKQSTFAVVYGNGGIPCVLVHGSVKHKISWHTDPESVPFDPVLPILAEGLRETVHPYSFVARQGFKELLEVSSAAEKCRPVLDKVIPCIRAALISPDEDVFTRATDALIQLSGILGESLNPHLKTLLMALAKHLLIKKHKEKVIKTLQALETNGGHGALSIIKSKIPTYGSIHQ